MTSLPGRLGTFAIKKGSTWHTAVAAGATDALLINSESVIGSYAEEQLMDETVGLAFRQETSKGNQTVAGTIDLDLRYSGKTPILMAAVMGIDDSIAADTTAEEHKFIDDTATPDTVPTNVDGIYFTLAQQLDSARVAEVPSAKITGFTISGSKGQVVTASYNVIGDTINYNAGSGTNNTTTIATVTYTAAQEFATNNRVVVDERAKLEISTFTANSLAEVSITDFELTFDRNSVGANTTNDSSMGVDEPRSNGYETAQLSVTFDVSDSDTLALFDSLQADTKYFGKLTFDNGVVIGSTTQTAQWIFEFRHMRVNTAPPPSIIGPGKSPVTVVFDLLSDDTQAETGISGAFDGPIGVFVYNSTAGNYI